MNEALRRELLTMRDEDQAARNPVDIAKMADCTRRHVPRLQAIIAEHGWPGRSLVGDDGANAAWLIVQHAGDLEFMQEALTLVREAAAAGEMRPTLLAYLEDRVNRRLGRSQRYGTQLVDLGEDVVGVEPLEDPPAVERIRSEAGLEPLWMNLAGYLGSKLAEQIGRDGERTTIRELIDNRTVVTIGKGDDAVVIELAWDPEAHVLRRSGPHPAAATGA